MPGFLFRTLSSFFVGCTLVFLVYTTFFYTPQETQSFSLKSEENIFGSGNILQTDTFYSQRISPYESLFSENGQVKYTKNDTSFIVDIRNKARYFSSLRDIQTSYLFENDQIQILQKGLGEVYIDTFTSSGKVFIFPVNTSLEIQLFTPEKSLATKIFLGPKMYIELDSSKVAKFKNADALRVETLSRIGYVTQSISLLGENPLFEKYGFASGGLVSQALQQISENDAKIQSYIAPLESLEIQEMLSENILERYAALFLNDEKKKIYYKNKILGFYRQLLLSQKSEDALISRIEKYGAILESLDRTSYMQMQELQSYLEIFTFSHPDPKYIVPYISFASIQNTKIPDETIHFSIYSAKIFQDENTKEKILGDLFEKYIQSYVDYLGKSKDDTKIWHQYFLYNLEGELNLLLSENLTSAGVRVVSEILKNYIIFSESAYSLSSSVGRSTLLYKYDELLKNIDIALRNSFFETQRNQKGLLVVSQNRFPLEAGTQFKQELEKLFNTTISLENYFSSSEVRELSTMEDIRISRNQLKEYLLALENYQSYSAQYDITKSKDVFITENQDTARSQYSEVDILNFLSGFRGVDISSLQILPQDGYFRIENMYISGKMFAFDIYPYSTYFKINKLSIDGKMERFMYNIPLKNEDDTFDKSADFFLNTFFGTTGEYVQDFNEVQTSLTEDKSTIVLKRDILLGKNGHFQSLKNILDISYDTIQVQNTSTGTLIFLQNIPTVSLENSVSPLYFSAQYIFSQSERYFRNITFTSNTSSAKISLAGKISLTELPDIIATLKKNQKNIFELENKLLEYYPQREKNTLQYIKSTKKTSFKFDSQGKKYTITLNGDTVEKMYISTQNILPSPVNISEIDSYFQ